MNRSSKHAFKYIGLVFFSLLLATLACGGSNNGAGGEEESTATPIVIEVDPISGQYEVVANTAPLRSGPGYDYELVREAVQGEVLDVDGQTNSGSWLRVAGGDWVSEAFVEPLAAGSADVTAESTKEIVPPDEPEYTPTLVLVTLEIPTVTATTTPTPRPTRTPLPPDTPTWVPTTTVVPPPPSREHCVPTLIDPVPGQVMDNGRTDRNDEIVWEFSWRGCPMATSYQLYVIGPTASGPLIDQAVSDTFYWYVSSGGYIANQNRLGWSWRVRTLVGGRWTDWSAPRFFDVEPVNSDPG